MLPTIHRMIMSSNGQKPEETTYIKQGVGQYIEMITVNEWYAGGKGGGRGKGGWVSAQSSVERGKDFCPNFLQPFHENIDRRSCNDGSRELIPVFHNPHWKC